MRPSRTGIAFGIVLMLVVDVVAAAESATEILNKTGIHGGIACVIGADDPAMVEKFAKEGGFIVHLLDPDPARVAEAKSELAASGLLGRKVFVDTLTSGTLPHADHLLDLVVAEPGVPVAEKEILRVLAPARGKAWLGGKVLGKPALPGAGDWTHRMGNPGNNPASTDTAFQPPMAIQYIALPFQTSFHGTMLTEGGLRAEMSDWTIKKPDRIPLAGKLMVRSQANGTVLWQTELPKGIEPDWPISALVGGRFYIAEGEANRVRVYDGAAGERLPDIVMPGDDLRVRWMAIENGRLHALLGEPASVRDPLSSISARQTVVFRVAQGGAGHRLVALDLNTGKQIFQHDEPGLIDYRTVALDKGRTYFYTIDTRAGCLDEDGRLVWENDDSSWLEKLSQPGPMNANHESASTLIAGPGGQIMLTVPRHGRESMIFDKATGALVFTVRAGSPKNFFVGDKLHTGFVVYEAATGEEVDRNSDLMSGMGCGIATWVPGLESGVAHVDFGFKSPCGVGSHAAGGLLQIAPSQCDCGHHIHATTALATAGEAMKRAEAAPAHPLVKGPCYGAVDEAGASVSQSYWPNYRGDVMHWGVDGAPVPETARLRWTAAVKTPLAVPEGHDWHRMEWLDRPTAPVTAGGMAFYGTSDGAVRGVNLSDGKVAWTCWTSGAVLTSPVAAGQRVFAASGDGWVYALDAKSGELAWRWRAAPAERIMPVCGRLMSTWPVIAVLAHEGTVYGVAGQWAHNGSLTFALDPATGKPRWTHWTPPHVYHVMEPFLSRDNPGFSPSGQLIAISGKLYIRAYLGFPAVFDMETGERIADSQDLKNAQAHHSFRGKFSCGGQEFIGLDDRRLLYGGGNSLLSNPDMRHEKRMSKFILAALDENGMMKGLENPVHAIPSSHIAPALDGGQILIVGGIGGREFRGKYEPHGDTLGLSLWDLDAWCEHATAGARAGVGRKQPEDDDDSLRAQRIRSAKPNPYADWNASLDALDMDKALWRVNRLDLNAIALTPNAAIAAHGVSQDNMFRRYSDPYPEFEKWQLTAFSRADGSTLWSVDLPGEPIFNGIAPTGDGSWIVVLRDGSVACVGK